MKAPDLAASSASSRFHVAVDTRVQARISGSNLSTSLRSRRPSAQRLPFLPLESPPSLYSRASGMRDYSCAAVGGPSSADIITRNQRGSFIRLSTWVVERDEGRPSPRRVRGERNRARARARAIIGGLGRLFRQDAPRWRGFITIRHRPDRTTSSEWTVENRGPRVLPAGSPGKSIGRNFVAN